MRRWADPTRTLRGLRRSCAIKRLRGGALLQRHPYPWSPMDAPETARDHGRCAARIVCSCTHAVPRGHTHETQASHLGGTP